MKSGAGKCDYRQRTEVHNFQLTHVLTQRHTSGCWEDDQITAGKKEADKDPLKTWHFARREPFEVPDGDTIEQHASSRLSRALNIGRVTAFVGSGASMAYGRTSWIDMLVDVQDIVLARYVEQGANASAKATKLYQMLLDNKITRTKSGDESQQLLVFQFAEELDAELKRTRQEGKAETETSQQSFRGKVMELTRDHLGHAGRLTTILKRSTSDPDYQPNHLTIAKLVYDTDPIDRNEAVAKAIETATQSAKDEPNPQHNPREIRDPILDPLAITFRDLAIKRFFTLNYDHEIEFLLQSERGALESAEPRVIVFDETQCGALITAAVGGSLNPPFVVHLHGRAESDAGGTLIVTEQDYKRRYHRPGRMRRLIDDSIRIAFSSSTLLFLGVGMKEIDLLRPLKQLLGSDRDLGDQLAVALLPALDKSSALQLQKIKLLKEFGVYTIHYGQSKADGSDTHWLYRLNEIQKIITKAFDHALPSALAGPDEIRDQHWKENRIHFKTAQSELRKLGINHLVFKAPQTIDQQASVNVDNLQDALNSFRSVTEWFQRLPYAGPLQPTPSFKRRLVANNLRIRGAFTKIITWCLCNKLRNIRNDHVKWRSNCFELPKPRMPLLNGDTTALGFPLFRRHMLELPSAEDALSVRPTLDNRFYSGAPSQTFATVLSALKNSTEVQSSLSERYNHQRKLGLTIPRRRTFLLLSSRGVGRGHFFAALQDASSGGRLGQFIKAIGTKPEDYGAAGFFNLAFSLEIKSVFDQITELVWRFGRDKPLTIDGLKTDPERANSKLDQRYKMARAFDLYTSDKRLLICLSGVEVLFTPDGRPKNRHVGELFDLLVGQASERAPLDLLLLCSESGIPLQFRKPAPSASGTLPQRIEQAQLFRSDISAKVKADLSERARRLQLNVTDKRTSGKGLAFITFLHHPRASAFTSANF